MSSDVKITASYETGDRGSLRVLQKTTQLPLKMMLRACPPENTSTFTATIKCSEPLVAFSQLFPGKSIGIVVYSAPLATRAATAIKLFQTLPRRIFLCLVMVKSRYIRDTRGFELSAFN